MPTNEKKDETINALEKKTKAEIEEGLKKDWLSEEQTISSKHYFIHKRVFLPTEIFAKSKDKINDRILALKIALKNPDLHAELIDEILNDLIVGAYQNRSEAYSISLSEDNINSTEAMGKLQRQRQLADIHLLNIIKAIRDIKHPPVQVVVKQAEQVNVGEQINQADKQVNISKEKQSA